MQFIYKASIHDDAASGLFGAGDIVHASGAPSPCLLIGFVNRSGSNYFAELLRSTGEFAGMTESLNDTVMRSACTTHNLRTATDYLQHLQHAQTERPGQVWGVKAGWAQIAMLLRWRAIPNLLAPRMVIVSRKDVVSQAVSLYIASHTKQWRSVDTAVAHDEIKYDGKRIMNTIRSITRAYAMLKQVAVLAQIPHQEIHYEDLLAAPEKIIAQVTETITGRALQPRLDEIAIAVQRNALNAELKAQFLADLPSLKWKTGLV